MSHNLLFMPKNLFSGSGEENSFKENNLERAQWIPNGAPVHN